MNEHICRLNADPDDTSQQPHFGLWPALALRLFQSLLASLLDLLDLADNEPQPRQIALQLGQGILAAPACPRVRGGSQGRMNQVRTRLSAAMQGRPKAIIDGFGCMPRSLDYLRLPLVEISEGGPRRNLGTEALSREEPEVRIHLPPGESHANFRFLSGGVLSVAGCRPDYRKQPAGLGKARFKPRRIPLICLEKRGLFLLPVGPLPTSVTCPLRSTGITPLPCYYRAVRPCPPHRYFRPRRFAACTFSLGQSSASQVEHNRESTERQYALASKARELGWPAERIVVIDEDLGLSGGGTATRSDFARLTAEVALARVGLFLGLEVSRLARNNAEWYRLIDLAGLTDTLIGDGDGLYHPAVFNDPIWGG
jgi:hypothetical protein